MKSVFFIVTLIVLSHSVFGQSKNTHYWMQTKTTDCKDHKISPSIQVGNQTVNIGVAYTWSKTKCDEFTAKNAIKVPKLKSGYHIAPDDKHYYNTGKVVYQIVGKSCGIKTWTPSDFWIMMQNHS